VEGNLILGGEPKKRREREVEAAEPCVLVPKGKKNCPNREKRRQGIVRSWKRSEFFTEKGRRSTSP